MNMDDIINRYLNNSVTVEEKESLLRWLEEKEENRATFKTSYDLWLYSHAVLTSDTDMEAALLQLKNKISSSRKKAPLMYYFMRIAVAVLLLFSASYIGYTFKTSMIKSPMIMNRLLTASSGKGQFVLPDGSTVWLNSNSVLEYPETFTDGKRIVSLKGEALFEVKKNKEIPFLVQTGGMNIEVLGTRFLVQNYPDKSLVEAVLVEGSIQIGGGYFRKSQILVPGQMISYNKSNAQTTIKTVESSDYINWIHSKLVFDNHSLADIIINLEKWYGVEIIASSEFAESVHMSFTIRSEPLDEVLKYMSVTAPIFYEWEDDKLHLKSK